MAATRGWSPRAERGLARGILAESGLNDVAHDDFVDLRGLDAGAAHGFGDGFGAELRRGERGESALKFADRGADGGEDDGFGDFGHF